MSRQGRVNLASYIRIIIFSFNNQPTAFLHHHLASSPLLNINYLAVFIFGLKNLLQLHNVVLENGGVEDSVGRIGFILQLRI